LGDSGFLHQQAATMLAERLAATNRKFIDRALLFDGPLTENVASWLSTPEEDGAIEFEIVPHIARTDGVLALEPESKDLIVSVFELGQIEKLPELLIQILNALKQDGLFLAACLCGRSFEELRDAFLVAESRAAAGVSTRVTQFPELRDLGNLLETFGFKLPVADLENRTIRYTRLETLFGDLRNTGCTYLPKDRTGPMSRKVVDEARRSYRENHADPDGKLRLTIEIGFLSGWKAHESQQQPKRRGSAKNRLSDFL
jgi:hypothetical protein